MGWGLSPVTLKFQLVLRLKSPPLPPKYISGYQSYCRVLVRFQTLLNKRSVYIPLVLLHHLVQFSESLFIEQALIAQAERIGGPGNSKLSSAAHCQARTACAFYPGQLWQCTDRGPVAAALPERPRMHARISKQGDALYLGREDWIGNVKRQRVPEWSKKRSCDADSCPLCLMADS